MTPLFRLLLLSVSGLRLLTDSGPAAEAADVPVWGVFEQELTSTTDHDNPFAAKVAVEFRGPSGQQHTRLAFWDGGQVYQQQPSETGAALCVLSRPR